MVNGGAELGLWLQLKGQQAFRLGFDPANRAFDHRSTDNFPALMWCSSELPHWTRGLHVSFRRSEARGPLTPRSPGVSPDAYGEPQQPRQSHGNKARFGGFQGRDSNANQQAQRELQKRQIMGITGLIHTTPPRTPKMARYNTK